MTKEYRSPTSRVSSFGFNSSFVIRISSLSPLHSWLRYANYQSQVEEQKRRGEKQTIQKIERAANSREKISRVLYVSAALDDGFSQVAEHCGESEEQSQNRCVSPGQCRQMARH